MIASMKGTKQFCRLSPMNSFFCAADSPQDRRSKTLDELSIIGLSILCLPQSGIRHLHWLPHKLSDSQQ
jgi:hypothetical protein